MEKRQHSGYFLQPRLYRNNEQNAYAKVAVPESPPSALSGLKKKKGKKSSSDEVSIKVRVGARSQ